MLSQLLQSSRRARSLTSFMLAVSLLWVPALFRTNSTSGQDRNLGLDLGVNSLVGKRNKPDRSYGTLPLSFELNQGQTNGRVKFLARAGGYLLFLTPTEAVMALDNPTGRRRGKENREARAGTNDAEARAPRRIIRMKLQGANPEPLIEGLEQSANTTNYFTGSDPTQWRTDIPSYARVRYGAVYPGIDMVYYGDQRRLEYDFVVAPGADPNLIQMAFKGIENFEITRMGDLLLRTAQGDIRQSRPVAYQERDGTREEVSAGYSALGEGRVGFQVGAYDPTRRLIIDPVLVYSTYLGGSGFDQGYAVAVDSFGNSYVTGKTAAADFPTTAGAFQTNYGGGDAFIAKLDPTGTRLIYSTYLNGASGNGIAVDAAGNAYVTGEAGTTNFPTTAGAFQTSPMGFDTFVTKLNPTGSSLVYSARFGGNFDDFGRGIALDSAGNAFITGWTACRANICTYPTVNAFQPNYAGGNNDAFVTKINSQGSALVYSTYLGGGAIINGTEDWGEAIAVDNAGSAYVTGYTYSPDFPVTSGAYDTSRAGLDAFVTKFAPNGTSLVYSTFLGGAGRELGQGIAVDVSGNAYVTGLTESSDNPFTQAYEGFPVTPGAFQNKGSFDAFVTKFNAQGSALVYSTYLGGSSGVDRGWAIAVDGAGSAYVTGDTTATNFPTASPIQNAYGGGLSDAFVTKLNAAGSGLVYSTFLGGNLSDEGRGIALDQNGDAYATGDTSSSDFPTVNPVQGDNGGGLSNHDDAFVVRIGSAGPLPTPTPTPLPTATPTPTPVLPVLSSLTLNPTSVNGGDSSTCTVTLSGAAPAGGAVVSLASDSTLAVITPSVTVAGGATSVSVTVITNRAKASTSVTISGAYGGQTRSAQLMVKAPVDSVAIQRVDYFVKGRFLRIDATSTERRTVLQVYVTSTGALIGPMTRNGNGSHSAQLAWPTNPNNVTVRSIFGGSASKQVTLR
jgi:hypothetical protein